MTDSTSRLLVSLPVTPARLWRESRPSAALWEGFPAILREDSAFVSHDPEERRLGSGGGTVHLLHEAWAAAGTGQTFEEWIAAQPSVVLHAGGESRRLPGYAGAGKTFLPIPTACLNRGARIGQTLVDLQAPLYRETLQRAGAQARVMLASGDVWLDFDAGDIPELTADVVGLGMRVSPEEATPFGVFFVGRHAWQSRESPIEGFLQKPTVEEIHKRLTVQDFYVDTGLWLLSEAAVRVLDKVCGWDATLQQFATADGLPGKHDFYGEFARALGDPEALTPELAEAGIGELTSAVVPLENAEFHHLGTTRQLLETYQNLASAARPTSRAALFRTFGSNGAVDLSPDSGPVLLDAVASKKPLQLEGFHVLNNLPESATITSVPRGFCVEAVPVGEERFGLRIYHLDDRFRGTSEEGAVFCGRPVGEWLKARGVKVEPGVDLQQMPLFPVVKGSEINDAWLQWFAADKPEKKLSKKFLEAEQKSAADLARAMDLKAVLETRIAGQQAELAELVRGLQAGTFGPFFGLDLAWLAETLREGDAGLRKELPPAEELVDRITLPTDRARLLAFYGLLEKEEQAELQRESFSILQDAVLEATVAGEVRPRLALKEDQIVWARSPVRLDLAGGWTDTPPYCLLNGGSVLNVAVNLNGQPPIQVFARPTKEKVLRLRSIDLGLEETISTNEDLETFRDPKSGFSLGKAAFALSGFLEPFGPSGLETLADRLEAFGSGLEVTLLCAVPKGSGLGTSSILGATLLAALNRACDLRWEREELYRRVLAMEQLLTTGGGWQDQAGALYGGVKLIESQPGPRQDPLVRYLPPSDLFDGTEENRVLLYYTGITRLAKNILGEIVQEMFLGTYRSERALRAIRANAHRLFRGFQTAQPGAVTEAIRRSWDLNRDLDPGTTNEAVEALIEPLRPHLEAFKLLGAGGGGYLLMIAQDGSAASRIRRHLEQTPPNPRARFVDVSLSRSGMEVTVS